MTGDTPPLDAPAMLQHRDQILRILPSVEGPEADAADRSGNQFLRDNPSQTIPTTDEETKP